MTPIQWLARWGITGDELNEVLTANPSLRGVTIGYLAEFKLRKLLEGDPRLSGVKKYDDHDRTRKHDLVVIYEGEEITFEAKSLQTTTVRETAGGWTGKAQVDASDRRGVIFQDGSAVQTTCLLRGGFDVLAVNLFAFGDQWRWGFARNTALPASPYKKYTDYQRRALLASSVSVFWPLQPPFAPDPFGLMDEIVRERASQK